MISSDDHSVAALLTHLSIFVLTFYKRRRFRRRQRSALVTIVTGENSVVSFTIASMFPSPFQSRLDFIWHCNACLESLKASLIVALSYFFV